MSEAIIGGLSGAVGAVVGAAVGAFLQRRLDRRRARVQEWRTFLRQAVHAPFVVADRIAFFLREKVDITTEYRFELYRVTTEMSMDAWVLTADDESQREQFHEPARRLHRMAREFLDSPPDEASVTVFLDALRDYNTDVWHHVGTLRP